MKKYMLKRLLLGILSAMAATVLVMVMIYSLLDREQVFMADPVYTKKINNAKETYKYRKWEEYGYLDYVPYSDYMNALAKEGKIDEETLSAAVKIARKAEDDSEEVKEYVQQFTEYYESKGYTIKRLPAVTQGRNKIAPGGAQELFAYKDKPLISRVLTYFTGVFKVDNIHAVEQDVGERGLTFTLYDPLYGGQKFAPAIIGNGTHHKYLLYVDDQFPFVHQNLLTINLGTSYTVSQGIDVFTTMTQSQGSYIKSLVTYPTGHQEMSADDLHTATYQPGSRESNPNSAKFFDDDYTNVATKKTAKSKIGFSFVLGICSSIMAYAIGLPAGIVMARKKDKAFDKIGTCYIVFSLAVPSLAYIFMVKAIGNMIGLPTTFDVHQGTWLMYLLPIISLALPSIGNLMKWMRRYMIDQMNSDYVRFARAGGLSEHEIFTKHIFKNAAIPIIHGIPGTVLSALIGAIITERVYVVPGAGNLLTTAINNYDNAVIVGLTLFYALLSVVSIILGDLLMSMVDPRISFVEKAR